MSLGLWMYFWDAVPDWVTNPLGVARARGVVPSIRVRTTDLSGGLRGAALVRSHTTADVSIGARGASRVTAYRTTERTGG